MSCKITLDIQVPRVVDPLAELADLKSPGVPDTKLATVDLPTPALPKNKFPVTFPSHESVMIPSAPSRITDSSKNLPIIIFPIRNLSLLVIYARQYNLNI